jgi:hypothetical protein
LLNVCYQPWAMASIDLKWVADLALTDAPGHLHTNSIKNVKYRCHSAS